MPLMLPNAGQYQGARGTRAQGSVSSREVVVLKSTSFDGASRRRGGGRTLDPSKGTKAWYRTLAPSKGHSLSARPRGRPSRIPLGPTAVVQVSTACRAVQLYSCTAVQLYDTTVYVLVRTG
eukprot:SAG25_NODE_86_length_16515_cov_5.529996_4_plen_121_part_00